MGGDSHLSPLAKRFRDRVLAANDPYRLILEEIPELFSAESDIESGLRQCVGNLAELDAILSRKFETTLLEILGGGDSEELSLRCERVANNASRPEIENFARRLGNWARSRSAEALETLMALVVGVRKESWTDETISIGYEKLRDLCRQFRRHESFNVTQEHAGNGTVPVSLIYNDSDGALIEREQFLAFGSDPIEGDKGAIQSVKGELCELSKDQRVRILVQLLADEMDPVGDTM